MAKFGLQPVIGDLVYAPEEEVCDTAVLKTVEEVEKVDNTEKVDNAEKVENVESPPEGEGGEETCGSIQRAKKRVILLDENNVKDFTIYDVVLPLPGFDVQYPTHEAGQWYTELLQADGLADSGFKQSVK